MICALFESAMQNWNSAARYALGAKRLDDALEFGLVAAGVSRPGMQGQANYNTLSTLADVQDAKGMTAEAKTTREKALNHGTATPQQLDQYARNQLRKGNKEDAVRVWATERQALRPGWPVNAGLMPAHSAEGRFKEALKYASSL